MNNSLGIMLPMGQNKKRLMEGGQWSLWASELTEYRKTFDHVELFEYRHYDWRRFFESLLLTITEGSRLRRCSVLKAVHLTGAIPCFMTKLLYGIPYVLSFGYHYDEFARVEKKWCQWILAKLFTPLAVRSADAVMVPTDFLRKYVERQGAKRAVVIPNGADTRRFAPDQGSKVKDQKAKSILFVGRFEPQKNLVELIRAVHLLQQTQVSRSKFRKTTRDRVPFFGKIVLTFVGQGSQKALLTRIAEKLGVSLHIVSPVSNEHLAHFYLRGGVFVLPSLVEGHPKALLEAMSCGLPVIASDIPGCRNIVTNQHDGLLVRPTVGGLQRGLEQLLNDQGFAAKLGRNARQTIVSKFDKKKLMEREMKVLHKTIGDR